MLYAATDAADPDHAFAAETLVEWPGELVVSAFTAAEADHLIIGRLGIDAELAFLGDLSESYLVESLSGPDVGRAAEVCRAYRDLELGLADASIVVLADRWSTHTLASFDQRHFRAVPALDGSPFTLLPQDR